MSSQKVLIIGAHGRIALQAEKLFLENTPDNLVLFLRNASRMADDASKRVTVVQGDATDEKAVLSAIEDNHATAVYVNVAGPMEKIAQAVISAMDQAGVKKLVFIASLGIYDEVPGAFGRWNNAELADYLPPYKKAVALIEASDLDYTVIRPAWLTDKDEIDYETTGRHDPFKGTEVSRKSVADLVVRAVDDTTVRYARTSLGVDKPGTDGDKPAFIS